MSAAHIRDIDLFYRDEGAGEPVVLIHGHTLDHRMWDAQTPALLDAGYRVIRYDLRGHGRSGATADGNSNEEMAVDLAALLARLGIERAHIVGLSRGGGIALTFALDFASATRSLTLIDSVLPGRRSTDEFNAFMRGVMQEYRERGMIAFEETWFNGALFAPARRDPALEAALLTMIRGYSAAELAATEPPRPRPSGKPPADQLDEIAVPALVIVGELDEPHFLAFADELASGIRDARGVVVPGAGHMANMEQPEVVNAALVEFLRSA